MRRVALVGGGVSDFGKRAATWRDLAAEAVKLVVDDVKGLSKGDIDGLLVATCEPERFAFQSHVANLVAEIAGVSPRRLLARVELLCASGSSAIRLGYAAIASGLADAVLVVGVEKMLLPNRDETTFHFLTNNDKDWDSIHGLMPPAGWAFAAHEYMKTYGATEEDLALISVKNHGYASSNPHAQFKSPVTVDQVMKSRAIAPPLKLLDCCAISDGSAGVLLAAEDVAKKYTDTPVYIIGTGQAGTAGMSMANVPNWTEWESCKIAARDAYQMAGISPDKIDIAELHDCFTIAEMLEYENLGFTGKGTGFKYIREGQSEIGGKIPVNTDGGLLGKGHPIGATGVSQAVEVLKQLRGEANRQVGGAEIGMTHNASGITVEHTIVVYGR